MSLYRYKQIIDDYTTHYVRPPLINGSPVESFFEHCTIGAWTYVTCGTEMPAQNPLIEFALVAADDAVHSQVMAASVHAELVAKRVLAGVYMREDKHIVPGDEQVVADWTGATIQAWSNPANWYANPVMKDNLRTFGGKLWKSLMDYNVWEPPIGWREVVATGYPEWVQPTGAHDAYKIGDRVMFNGQSYESVINANVWSPAVYAAGWKVVA